ncbi:hypothetical protein D3C76_1536590 [compost metagenome]
MIGQQLREALVGLREELYALFDGELRLVAHAGAAGVAVDSRSTGERQRRYLLDIQHRECHFEASGQFIAERDLLRHAVAEQ